MQLQKTYNNNIDKLKEMRTREIDSLNDLVSRKSNLEKQLENLDHSIKTVEDNIKSWDNLIQIIKDSKSRNE